MCKIERKYLYDNRGSWLKNEEKIYCDYATNLYALDGIFFYDR